MSTLTAQVLPSPPSSDLARPDDLPPLEQGDRLSRDEFERRYEAMPSVKKAELIEGVVYMPSPVRLEFHGEQHVAISHWLATYWVATPGAPDG